MALTYADFAAKFPELVEGIDDPSTLKSTIEALLLEVETIHIPTAAFYGSYVTYARLLLTAHFYDGLRGKYRHGADGVGPIASKSEQDGSTISFSSQKFDGDDNELLQTTPYGRRLMRLDQTLSGCLTGFVV